MPLRASANRMLIVAALPSSIALPDRSLTTTVLRAISQPPPVAVDQNKPARYLRARDRGRRNPPDRQRRLQSYGVAMPGKQVKKQAIALGGVAEVAEMLCISKSALAERRRHGSFPEPLVELACGPIWDLDMIDACDHRRHPDPRAAGRWINYPGRWHQRRRI
jgi:hypothetical protein